MQKIALALVIIYLVAGLNPVLAEPEEETNNKSEHSERAAYLDPELKQQMALAKTLKAHEIVWLEVSYPDIVDTRKVLAISSPSLIAEKKGAVLLLHDKEQHADWPEVIHPLRKKLPKSGWFTLSVNLPDETRVQIPERSLQVKAFDQVLMSASLKSNLESGARTRNKPVENEPAESVESDTLKTEITAPAQSNDEESVDIDLAAEQKRPDLNKIPYAVRSLSHMEKAYEYLQSQNYQNVVVIAYGHSAELAFQYIKDHQTEVNSPGFALVLIEPFLPESYLIDLSEWLGKDFKAPILEIIDRNNMKAVEDAENRKYSVLRTGAKQYRQILLSVSNNDIYDENLTRRVRAWLDASAPGLEVGF
jgi:hypothetical protein